MCLSLCEYAQISSTRHSGSSCAEFGQPGLSPTICPFLGGHRCEGSEGRWLGSSMPGPSGLNSCRLAVDTVGPAQLLGHFFAQSERLARFSAK